jgi:DNA polymerase III delta prime subunit
MAGITDLSEQEELSFSSLHEAFQKYGGRILLLGEPGTGKTTTLMAFARDMIAKRLENPNQPLPIIIPVVTWDAEKRSPLTEWLAEAVPLLKESLDHIIKNRRALFILDGLDELGAVQEDSKTREKYDPRSRFLEVMPTSSQVVISCRVKEYHDIGAKMAVNGAATLQPLDDLQLKQYLQNLPYLWDMLQEDDNLRQVARTPLLLSLFGYAFAGLAEEAKQLQYSGRGELRDKIFEVYVARRYQHEARKPHSQVRFSLEEIYSILGSVSLYQCSYGDVRGARVDNWLEDERVLQFEALVEELHIVREHENHKPRFMHLLLRDYFAYPRAVKLLQRRALDGDTITAIRALGNIGDERAIELLIEKEDVIDEYARGEQIGWLASDAIALIKGKS